MQAFKLLPRIHHRLHNIARVTINSSVPSSSSSSPIRFKSTESSKNSHEENVDSKAHYYPNTSVGIKERTIKADGKQVDPLQTPYPPFPDGKNPKTGETGGPTGPEPTRFGDWERKGRVTDF